MQMKREKNTKGLFINYTMPIREGGDLPWCYIEGIRGLRRGGRGLNIVQIEVM